MMLEKCQKRTQNEDHSTHAKARHQYPQIHTVCRSIQQYAICNEKTTYNQNW